MQATFRDVNIMQWINEFPMVTLVYDMENKFLLVAFCFFYYL